MTNGAAASQDPPDDLGRPLPEPVRQRVVGMASDTLGELTADEVPSALRPFARFAPGRRARLAAIPIAAAVDADADFRARVADRIRTLVPDLAAAVTEGRRPSAVDPMDVAATAYVLRPQGWENVVGEVLDQLERETASLAGERESESLHPAAGAAGGGARRGSPGETRSAPAPARRAQGGERHPAAHTAPVP